MNKLAISTAILMLSAAPAFANSVNVDVHGSVTALDNNGGARVGYGGDLGYDFDLGKLAFAGVQVGADGVPLGGYTGRNLSSVARLGVKVPTFGRVYALAGYANQRAYGTNYDGFRAGAGIEHSFGGPLFGKVEYRHTSYAGLNNQNEGLIGVGARF